MLFLQAQASRLVYKKLQNCPNKKKRQTLDEGAKQGTPSSTLHKAGKENKLLLLRKKFVKGSLMPGDSMHHLLFTSSNILSSLAGKFVSLNLSTCRAEQGTGDKHASLKWSL